MKSTRLSAKLTLEPRNRSAVSHPQRKRNWILRRHRGDGAAKASKLGVARIVHKDLKLGSGEVSWL